MKKQTVVDKIQMNENDFQTGAIEARLFNSVTNKIIQAENQTLIHEVSVRHGEAWSILANQVVGSEDF